jgi:6-phosphogluconolactonase
MTDVRIVTDTGQLVNMMAGYIVDLAKAAIEARGRLTLVLAGGSTPRALYEALASRPYSEQIIWTKVHVFWGDERCVPPDHHDSNYRMVEETLLQYVTIPANHIHRIKGELDPERAVAQQLAEWVRIFGDVNRPPRFDLILLGLGDDGHTASLFPGTNAVREQQQWLVAHYIEKLGAWRITMTPAVINAATHVAFMVTGEKKAAMLKNTLTGPYQPEVWPAQIVRPNDGELVWFVDAAAAALLLKEA